MTVDKSQMARVKARKTKVDR